MTDKPTVLVLMYGNTFVDSALLSKGIYEAYLPNLYRPGTTVDDVIDELKAMYPISKIKDLDSYFENLRKCRLRPYTLIPVKQEA